MEKILSSLKKEKGEKGSLAFHCRLVRLPSSFPISSCSTQESGGAEGRRSPPAGISNRVLHLSHAPLQVGVRKKKKRAPRRACLLFRRTRDLYSSRLENGGQARPAGRRASSRAAATFSANGLAAATLGRKKKKRKKIPCFRLNFVWTS